MLDALLPQAHGHVQRPEWTNRHKFVHGEPTHRRRGESRPAAVPPHLRPARHDGGVAGPHDE